MTINEEFYGAESTWKSFSTGAPEIKISSIADPDPSLSNAEKTAAEGSVHAFSYNSQTNPGGLASVPLDPSICPWGIGTGSDVFAQKYTYPSIVGGSGIDTFVFKVRTSEYYKENINNSYRFYLSSCRTLQATTGMTDGTWSTRYAELSLRTELSKGYIYQRPVLKFDYSKAYITANLLYVAKNYIDDKSTGHSSTTVNSVPLNRILLSDPNPISLDTNYIYGIQFQLSYEGIGSSHTLGIFPFDNIEPTDLANGPYYPYGREYTHYGTPFITTYDTGQIYRCAIGGTINCAIRDNNEFITTEKAIYDKNFAETACLRHYNFPTPNEGGTSTMSDYIRRSSTTVSLVPYIMNSMGRQEIYDYVMEQMAFLGFRFKVNSTDTDSYLPEINSNGVTTGRYFAPDDPAVESQQNYEWTTDVFEKSPYDPGSVDPNVYDTNTTVLNPAGANIYQKFSTRYLMTQAQLSSVASYLFNKISSESDSDFWSSSTLYVNNPLDVITQLTFYPLDLTLYQDDVYRGNVVLGSIDTEIETYINRKQNVVIDMGHCTYYPVYGVDDFRSYPPYSSAQLIIPYCGSVDIDPNLYLNHKIAVKMIIDTMTGSCLALIYRDEMVVDTLAGQIGINVPITGIQSQTVASAERQAQSQLKMARLSSITQFATAAASIAGGLTMGTGAAAAVAAYQFSAGSGAKALENIENAKFNLEHIEVPFKQIGTATPSTSYANERQCRLIIRRPVMMDYDSEVYEKTAGYACLKTGSVSDFTGYTEFQSVKLDTISATEAEKTLITKLLQSGVYL